MVLIDNKNDRKYYQTSEAASLVQDGMRFAVAVGDFRSNPNYDNAEQLVHTLYIYNHLPKEIRKCYLYSPLIYGKDYNLESLVSRAKRIIRKREEQK